LQFCLNVPTCTVIITFHLREKVSYIKFCLIYIHFGIHCNLSNAMLLFHLFKKQLAVFHSESSLYNSNHSYNTDSFLLQGLILLNLKSINGSSNHLKL